MALTVGQVSALTTKGIESAGGVADAIFKNHAFLSRLKPKEGSYSGEKKTFPFNYLDDTSTTGSFYSGAEALSLDMYDPFSELSFDLKEVQETLVITHLDLAKNSGKEARLNLIEQRLKSMEQSMRQRFTKAIMGDGTNVKEFVGIQAFLKSSSVNYGGVTDTDVPVHVAYVNSNGAVLRALTTALVQDAIGGASEGEEKPTVGIMRQNVCNQFLELLKPHQRTTRESTLSNLGHAGNTLVYSGIDHIIDNLAPATSIAYLNEKFVRLYAHPEYNMKVVKKDDLETMDAILQRLFYKGLFACNLLRYQSWLKDVIV